MACFVDYKSKDMDTHTMEMVKRSRALKKEFAPVNTEDKIWVHGLNCINTTCRPKENFINFVSIVGTKNEVCCGKLGEESRFSHPLGTIGLYVKGDCSLMANWDIDSFCVDGERHTVCTNGIVKDYEELGDCENTMSYSEAFVRPKEIVGAFVFKKAYDEYMSTTKETFWDEDIYDLEFLPEKERFIECLEAIKEAGIPINFV